LPEGKTAGKLPTGQKELLRGKVMEPVKRGELTIKAASKELKTSCRQGKAIKPLFTGKRSNRRVSEALREKAVEACREKYPDVGPAFAVEKPREVEGIAAGVSTVRRWLTGEGLRQSRKQRSAYRSRRGRRACEKPGVEVIPDERAG
jgi:hypothetical protein